MVVEGAIHSSKAKAATAWQRISHGFQVSGMLQYYSALPFNIGSGATTSGRSCRPDGQRSVHRPERRKRQRLFNMNNG